MAGRTEPGKTCELVIPVGNLFLLCAGNYVIDFRMVLIAPTTRRKAGCLFQVGATHFIKGSTPAMHLASGRHRPDKSNLRNIIW